MMAFMAVVGELLPNQLRIFFCLPFKNIFVQMATSSKCEVNYWRAEMRNDLLRPFHPPPGWPRVERGREGVKELYSSNKGVLRLVPKIAREDCNSQNGILFEKVLGSY